jgi:hypothetical protein
VEEIMEEIEEEIVKSGDKQADVINPGTNVVSQRPLANTAHPGEFITLLYFCWGSSLFEICQILFLWLMFAVGCSLLI